MHEDSTLQPYMFQLPNEAIAQHPSKDRGMSKLLKLDKATGTLDFTTFNNIIKLIPSKSVLVFNQVKVTPARLLGYRERNPRPVEAFILEPPQSTAPGSYDLWCLVKPGSKIKQGDVLIFEKDFTKLKGEVIAKNDEGQRLIRFSFLNSPLEVLETIGHMPLPPYIKRQDAEDDKKRYQTVYGKVPGAVAAPTAGLHFTEQILNTLKEQGHKLVMITLKVGAGTFAPLTQKQLDEKKLHQEFIEISSESASIISQAIVNKENLIAVGTTTLRALESAADNNGVKPYQGYTDIFIQPGYKFKTANGLITNFHLPGSSLLMLVAAFAGTKNILQAYNEAIAKDYKFYSYGDAMLII